METNRKTRYIPIIIAVSIVAGIFIGTFYANRFSENKRGLGIIGTTVAHNMWNYFPFIL